MFSLSSSDPAGLVEGGGDEAGAVKQEEEIEEIEKQAQELKMEERMAVELLHIPMEKSILVNLKKEKEQGRVFIHSREVIPIKALFGMDRKMAKVLLHIQMVKIGRASCRERV